MEIILRTEAKEIGRSRYFTGKPCKHGHLCERYVLGRYCIECSVKTNHNWRVANPKRDTELKYKWAAANPERRAEAQRIWQQSEKGKKNATTHKDAQTACKKDWKRRNPELLNEYSATRRATQLQATPSWLSLQDRIEIRAFYREAKRLEQETGVKQHVDHITPLQGKGVCGLHVPWNLQILTENENTMKGNNFD